MKTHKSLIVDDYDNFQPQEKMLKITDVKTDGVAFNLLKENPDIKVTRYDYVVEHENSKRLRY